MKHLSYPADAVGLGDCFVLPPEGIRFNTELDEPSTDCADAVSYCDEAAAEGLYMV
jgi:hypothetical protein